MTDSNENILYRSPTRFEAERIHAVVLYCSDGRFGEQFDDFAYNHLGLLRYDRLAIPGGPAELGRGTNDSLRRHVDFLVQAHEIDRAVLIQHVGCAYYSGPLGIPDAKIARAQDHDVVRARDRLHEMAPHLAVSAYRAIREENEVAFAAIPL